MENTIGKEIEMALAKKCDICGEFYDDYDGINGISLDRIDGKDIVLKSDTKDCCPECIKSILTHINTLKRNRGVAHGE